MADNDLDRHRDPIEHIDQLRLDIIALIAQAHGDVSRRDEAMRVALVMQGNELNELRHRLATIRDNQRHLIDIVLGLHQLLTGDPEPPPRLMGRKRAYEVAKTIAVLPKSD